MRRQKYFFDSKFGISVKFRVDWCIRLYTLNVHLSYVRPVKLLFFIFGRLSYSFFVILMVSGNGRLSYLILPNQPFLIKKWPIFDWFLALSGSNSLYYVYFSIRSTKDCIYNFRETDFRKNEWPKQWTSRKVFS